MLLSHERIVKRVLAQHWVNFAEYLQQLYAGQCQEVVVEIGGTFSQPVHEVAGNCAMLTPEYCNLAILLHAVRSVLAASVQFCHSQKLISFSFLKLAVERK